MDLFSTAVCVFVHRLQLLNTTVSSLAITINNVLTTTYTAIYGGDGPEGADGEELNLLVCPLTSISELQGLYTSNLIDFETAMYEQHPKHLHIQKLTKRRARSQARRPPLARVHGGGDHGSARAAPCARGRGKGHEKDRGQDHQGRAATPGT